MSSIDINLDGDGAWPDLASKRDRYIHAGSDWKLAALPNGTSGGKPSVALRFDLPTPADSVSGVIAEMSLATWIAATCALRDKYPEAFEGTPLEAP